MSNQVQVHGTMWSMTVPIIMDRVRIERHTIHRTWPKQQKIQHSNICLVYIVMPVGMKCMRMVRKHRMNSVIPWIIRHHFACIGKKQVTTTCPMMRETEQSTKLLMVPIRIMQKWFWPVPPHQMMPLLLDGNRKISCISLVILLLFMRMMPFVQAERIS